MSKQAIEIFGASTTLRGAPGGTPPLLLRTVYWPGGFGKLWLDASVQGTGTFGCADTAVAPDGSYLPPRLGRLDMAALLTPDVSGQIRVLADFSLPEAHLSFYVSGGSLSSDTVSIGTFKLIPV